MRFTWLTRLAKVQRRLIHTSVALAMYSVLVIIGREVWIYSKGGSISSAIPSSFRVLLKYSFLELVGFGLLGFATLLALRAVAENSLILLFASRWRVRQRYEYSMRFLSSLPTAVLGSAIVVTLDRVGAYPTNRFGQFVLILGTILFITLPTVMQVGLSSMKDFDRAQIEGYIALGAQADETARVFVVPAMRRTLNTAILLSASKVVIETYLVGRFAKGSAIVEAGGGIPDLFKSIYSAVTIEDNVILIVVLFFLSAFLNTSFMSAPLSKLSTG